MDTQLDNVESEGTHGSFAEALLSLYHGSGEDDDMDVRPRQEHRGGPMWSEKSRKDSLDDYKPQNIDTISETSYSLIISTFWCHTITRKSAILGRGSTSENNLHNTSNGEEGHIFIGDSKLISRRHIKLHYNDENKRWELYLLGKNGLLIDGFHYKPTVKNSPIILTSK